MAVPSYEDLLARHKVNSSLMQQTISDDHLTELASRLDKWETLARSLRLSSTDIENVKSLGDVEIQRYELLKCWKQRCGSMATYKALVEAFLEINRTDFAEKVVALLQSLRDSVHSPPSLNESNLTAPTSPTSSSGVGDASSSADLSLPATLSEHTAQEMISTLRELEEEFYDLMIYVEDILEKSKVSLNTMTRRFRMLPQSVRRQHETDENYKETRRRILKAKTIKNLFDNLHVTELKHWNYMTPDTLAHIIKDVKLMPCIKKIDKYKGKLMAFKANTKLRELIGISFPVPDYCMELTMEVEGWEDKTILEVETSVMNIMRRAAYKTLLGWKRVNPGSIKVTFILLDYINRPEWLTIICKDYGIIGIQIDQDISYTKDRTKVILISSNDPLWVRINI